VVSTGLNRGFLPFVVWLRKYPKKCHKKLFFSLTLVCAKVYNPLHQRGDALMEG
jgi:hypothetical protein